MIFNKKKAPAKPSKGSTRGSKKAKKGFAWGKWIFILIILMGATGAVAFSLLEMVPHDKASKKHSKAEIQKLLNSESLVYFSDGKTVLGSFFEKEHRRYVTLDQIPKYIQKAIVASEDARFYDHNGVDPLGMARAVWSNVNSGKLKAGGSTLSQQTAKNLYGRSGRNLQGKWEELQNTIQLEKNFSKDEILEFYLNQFHVVGSGRGVGIASEYFFNKQLKDLTLRECAFIAGSVKGPFNYDPYIQPTTELRNKALKRAEERTNYVLKRMLENNFISQKEYDQGMANKLTFVKGEFRHDDVSQLALIDKELKSPYFLKVLQEAGVENWQNEQLKIITTLDAQLQEEAQISLRRQLTNVGVMLEGYQEASAKNMRQLTSVNKGDLFTAIITEIKGTAKKTQKILLRAGDLRLSIDADQIAEFKEMLEKAPQSKGKSSSIIAGLKPEVPLLVSALASGDLRNTIPVRIESKTTLQGAGVIYKEGKILAAISGYDNTGYDRVFDAQRQFGSTWKPMLYALALKMGWHAQDMLDNENNAFLAGGRFYFPQADHKEKGSQVTMQWACTRSENIASVWLLSHLLDKKTPDEILTLAKDRGFAPKEGEDLSTYNKRLKEYGLITGDFLKKEIAFEEAKAQVMGENEAFKNALATLSLWPNNMIDDLVKGAQNQKSSSISAGLHWEHIKALYNQFKNNEGIVWAQDSLGHKGIFESDKIPENWSVIEAQNLDEAMLYGIFPVSAIQKLSEVLASQEIEENVAGKIAYSKQFKQALSLQLMAEFAKELGIRKPIKQVLSLVLGSNDISLFELTRAYQTLSTGYAWSSLGNSDGSARLIQKIVTKDGSVLFENRYEKKTVLEKEQVDELNTMLESVVLNGTGKSARQWVKMTPRWGGFEFPINGKTGTTNEYKNSVFVGTVATTSPDGQFLDYKLGTSIGTYVGYDLNKPMVNGGVKITGAQGALPYWSSLALATIRKDTLLSKLNFKNPLWVANKRIMAHFESEYKPGLPDPMTGKIAPLTLETPESPYGPSWVNYAPPKESILGF